MNLVIRPANVPQDYAAIAAVLAAESPGWAATAEDLAYDDASRDPRYHHAAFVAEATEHDRTLVVGVAFTELDKLALGKGRFQLNIRPDYLPDACFIALKDVEFVGYSNLLEVEEGYSTDMTGVLRPYRGKGVATLLKLRGIRYAQQHGKSKLWVVNDSVNAAMLGLNQKLGFVREGANIRYVKAIT